MSIVNDRFMATIQDPANIMAGVVMIAVGFALGLAYVEFSEWLYRRAYARRMADLARKPRIVSEINPPPPWTATPIGREVQKYERKSA